MHLPLCALQMMTMPVSWALAGAQSSASGLCSPLQSSASARASRMPNGSANSAFIMPAHGMGAQDCLLSMHPGRRIFAYLHV